MRFFNTAWDFSREQWWELINFESILFSESLTECLWLKYLIHPSKCRAELGGSGIVSFSCSRGSCVFFFQFLFRYILEWYKFEPEDLSSIIFLPLKESFTLFQMWTNFVIPSNILSQLELSRIEFPKPTPSTLMETCGDSNFLGWSILFYMLQPIRLEFLKKFVFELVGSSYSFIIICILC